MQRPADQHPLPFARLEIPFCLTRAHSFVLFLFFLSPFLFRRINAVVAAAEVALGIREGEDVYVRCCSWSGAIPCCYSLSNLDCSHQSFLILLFCDDNDSWHTCHWRTLWSSWPSLL